LQTAARKNVRRFAAAKTLRETRLTNRVRNGEEWVGNNLRTDNYAIAFTKTTSPRMMARFQARLPSARASDSRLDNEFNYLAIMNVNSQQERSVRST
jgi:spore coat protein CotF